MKLFAGGGQEDRYKADCLEGVVIVERYIILHKYLLCLFRMEKKCTGMK